MYQRVALSPEGVPRLLVTLEAGLDKRAIEGIHF
jgi:hypothetical protein